MSSLVEQLLAALEAGQIENFSDITEEQFNALKNEFGRGSFTSEQSAILETLVLVADGRDSEITAFNLGSHQHKLVPFVLADGSKVLPVSLLTWAGHGQGYSAAFDLFMQLPVRKVYAEDWPTVTD